MAVDYEAEYNNRARVPEHGDIIAGWERDAKSHREASPLAELGLSFGPSSRQFMDIFPGQGGGANAPLAMFIHGGYWRSLAPAGFSHMAKGLNAHGVTVAVAGYDLAPQVSIAQIIEQMRAACLFLWRTRKKRITVFGHSAGGHLAACMVATDWKALAPDAPADLVPAGVSISGLFDLAPLAQTSMNQDLKLDGEEARRVSPLFWRVPVGRTFDALVGEKESDEYLRQSRTIAEAWRQDLADTRYAEIPGANHFTAIAPLSDPGSEMVARIAQLARQVQGITL